MALTSDPLVPAGPSRTSPPPAEAGDEPQGRRPPSRLAWRPGLDGLRALAVTAVFAYHAGLGWARAGFLGVDVFFVLSGFLITALLLDDHHGHGRIRLARFWLRRARRLLPALAVLLAAVALLVPLGAQDQVRRLPGDLAAAAGYVSNWRLIFQDLSYFEAVGRPPILQHLWSLAVEEQFYLAWPLVLTLALRRWTARRLVVPLLVGAAASAALMAALYTPYADPSRVYYGTDTRVGALLVGAALACAAWRWMAAQHAPSGARLAVSGAWSAAGVAALVVLGLCVSRIDEFEPGLYRGGFLAVALLAAVVVAAAARPQGLFAAALGSRPLVWLGRRSYAVYLWFWPVIVLTRPHLDVPLDGTPLLVLRAVLTLALADASYRFVELPVRQGLHRRLQERAAAAAARSAAGLPRRLAPATKVSLGTVVAAATLTTGAVVAGGASGGSATLGPRPEGQAGTLAVVALAGDGGDTGAGGAEGARPQASPGAGTTVPPAPAARAAAAPEQAAPASTSAPDPQPAPTPALAGAWAVGDSVMAGAAGSLQAAGIRVDAEIGRQLPDVLAALRSLAESGAMGDAVVVQIGNNGPIGAQHVDQVMETVPAPAHVVLLTVKVERPWEDHNNQVIADGAARYSERARLADWHAVGVDRPDAFYRDGLHLTPVGRQLFTELVQRSLAGS